MDKLEEVREWVEKKDEENECVVENTNIPPGYILEELGLWRG